MPSPLPRRLPSWRVVLLAALVLRTVAACAGGEGTPAAPPPPAPVARVTTRAAVDTVLVGDRRTLAVQPVDASGAPLPGRPVAWSSLAPLVATVDAAGVVTGLVPGQTSVVATSEGQSATIAIVVLPQPVARVAFTDSAITRDIGDTVSAVARLFDRTGAPLVGRPVAYASSHPAVARVDAATGAITAVAPGTATISATSEGQVGTLRVTVLPPPPVARVAFAGGPLALEEGAAVIVTATTYDSLGRTLGDRPIAFTSTAPTVARVAADGRVTGVAAGVAAIVATSEGRTATLPVTVSRVPVAQVLLVVRGGQHVVGDTFTVAATAYSATGTTLPGRPTLFTSSAPAVASVDAESGLVRALAVGTTTVTAVIEGKSHSARVDVLPMPAVSISLAPTSLALDVGRTATLTVSARDRDGRATTATGVTFTSSAPAIATVAPATGVVTAVAAGSATITATVGTLRATTTVAVTQPPIVVPPPPSGTSSGPYTIDVRFVGTASADLQAIARQAAARWAQIVVAALPAHRVDISAGACDIGTPAVHETVQNLLVLVQIDAIDGVDGTVAWAGPCVLRNSAAGPGTGLPSVGAITLDSVDLRRMLSRGQSTLVQDVVTHEMGHILGIGTLWDPSWNPARALVPRWADATADLYYMGGAAIQASAALGFTLAGAPVPVENDGDTGTRGSHWRESTFRSELMTGYLNSRNPLSTITVGALRDLGYVVNDARADAFSPSAAPGMRLEEGLIRPRRVRDASGRPVVVPGGTRTAPRR